MKIGEKYKFQVTRNSIPYFLTVVDEPTLFRCYRPNDDIGEYGTLALVGDKKNSHYFVWVDAAVKGYLHKLEE